MLIIAIECSTKLASIAIFQDANQLAFESRATTPGKSINLPSTINKIIDNNGLSFDDIELYALSIGPGSYSGLRTAIATTQGLALPSSTPIFSVCSADVIAYQIYQKKLTPQHRQITILGDARRAQIWYRTYKVEEENLSPINDFSLLNYSDCSKIPPSYIASPDMDKLAPLLNKNISQEHTLQETPEYPLATTVALLANKAYKKEGEVSTKPERILPIYMHPAVQKG
jgi:tRNA threonylcarbamoyl adenosine modification protein YeaZ